MIDHTHIPVGIIRKTPLFPLCECRGNARQVQIGTADESVAAGFGRKFQFVFLQLFENQLINGFDIRFCPWCLKGPVLAVFFRDEWIWLQTDNFRFGIDDWCCSSDPLPQCFDF